MSEITPQPPESIEPGPQSEIGSDRISVMEVLSRMEGAEYNAAIETIKNATPESKRGYFDQADEDELEVMAAIYSLKEGQLKYVQNHPHLMGLHLRDLKEVIAKLGELTGEEKFLNSLAEDHTVN